ncbi:vitronectin isoform X2 [Gopherus evgoodei]|uniref:vitronectin isoform X2 n=1 Tax=Gopherus evgoodei TaxID=1825980 RepID=UPI0011CFEE81|nr:vitronectin isoform X2 [Gopherus evgoodei]
MRLLVPALMLALLCGAFAAEESCVGHCEDGFNAQRKCQCDSLCVYYQSCCSDYASACKTKVTRGDMFAFPEDDYMDYSTNATWGEDTEVLDTGTDAPTTSPDPGTAATVDSVTAPGSGAHLLVPSGPEEVEQVQQEEEEGQQEEVEELCSGKPFDAFTDLKNGSLYAFRGKYVYELDEKSVRPGYPKLIRDVWGIEGPVDAAFTRINCQGKTYIFQDSQYWRFDDGVLDSGYPRNISDGFQDIPDDIDAAFALPARSYHGQERVYFFKDKHYWAYDFANQPSRQDCEVSSPSLVFDHYALMQGDSWEDLFQLLFGGTPRSGATGPRPISRDWRGVPSHLDAAMAGRIYVSSRASSWARRRKSRRHRKRYRSRRPAAHTFWDWLQDESDSSDTDPDWLPGGSQCQPIQSVYFFVADKYYRLNLHSKRVDFARPRYPRPIAQYWLGCP